jgi:hypothetical protein
MGILNFSDFSKRSGAENQNNTDQTPARIDIQLIEENHQIQFPTPDSSRLGNNSADDLPGSGKIKLSGFNHFVYFIQL